MNYHEPPTWGNSSLPAPIKRHLAVEKSTICAALLAISMRQWNDPFWSPFSFQITGSKVTKMIRRFSICISTIFSPDRKLDKKNWQFFLDVCERTASVSRFSRHLAVHYRTTEINSEPSIEVDHTPVKHLKNSEKTQMKLNKNPVKKSTQVQRTLSRTS